MINFVLSRLLRDRFCDIIFLFPEPCIHGDIKFKKIKCHKILLSVFSDYFNNLFNFDSENVIIINGYSYEVFKMMIEYMYDNNLKIDFNDSNFLLESLQLSDEYMLTNYKIVILDKIKEGGSAFLKHFVKLCPHYDKLDANTLTMVYYDAIQLWKDGLCISTITDGLKLGSEIKDACMGTK